MIYMGRLCIGTLPGRDGIWLYEKDAEVYRPLARFVSSSCSERFWELRTKRLIRKDIRRGFDCNEPIPGAKPKANT